MRISVIIPVLNEAALIAQTLSTLQPLRAAGHELIVVDGGSSDDTIALSEPLADQIIRCSRGRGRQMNGGAKIARGDILLFSPHRHPIAERRRSIDHSRNGEERKKLGKIRCPSFWWTSPSSHRRMVDELALQNHRYCHGRSGHLCPKKTL